MSTSLTRLRVCLGALLLSLFCALPALADDIDIYNNPSANSVQPPATILVLDLNLMGICDNVVTNPNANSTCANLRATMTVTSLLGLVGGQSALQTGVAGLSQSALCALNGLLPIPLVNQLLCPLLSALGLQNLVTGLVSNVLNAGGVLLNQLPSATTSILDQALAAPLKVLTDPTSLISVLSGILQQLINTRVAILVPHSNRSSASGTQTTGLSTCSLADLGVPAHARQSTTNCSNGGYFLIGFTPLVDQTSVTALLTRITTLLTNALNPLTLVTSLSGLSLNPANLTPMFQGKENYDEIVHYLRGDAIYNAPLNRWDGLFALLGRDTSIETGSSPSTSYISPNLPCRNINVINIQLTDSLGDNDSDTDLLTYFPGVTLQPAAPQSGFANLVAAAQNTGFTDKSGNRLTLTSYFLIQNNLSSVAALTSVGTNVITYANTLGLIGLGQTIAPYLQPSLIVNASLLSASSTTSAGATANDLLTPAFFTIFKPDANATTAQTVGTSKPAWYGNLKRLDFNQVTNSSSSAFGTSLYTDANCSDASAVAGSCTSAIAADGRISTTALTWWTQTGTAKLGANSADGREATLGGAGQNIPGYAYGGGGNPGIKNAASSARQLYYDSLPASGVPALAALDADTTAATWSAERTALATSLNCPTTPTTDTTCQQLLLYARGFNVGTSSAPAANLTTVTGRSWLLGAVLHSLPVAINYGARTGFTATDPDIRVLFGSADGYLHMVKNGSSASPSGQEVWGFMPRTVMGNLKTLRDDAYSSPSNLGFPYGFDGAPAVLIKNLNATTGVPANAYAFVGLRRGGGSYYGLDLSNPDAPVLMWVLSRSGVYSATYSTPGLIPGSSSQFLELGQTFSTPVIGKILLLGETQARSVLIFAGGYNGTVNGAKAGKDLNNSRASGSTSQVGQDETVGNALYMIDAMTGQLLWKAAKASGSTASYSASSTTFSHPLLLDSIPSNVTAVDTDGDGYVDRAYVGDTGGHVWRADFPMGTGGADRSTWSLSLLASLGRHAVPASLANDRRFFHAPDYVPVRDPATNAAYDAVVIASGDREDPFNTVTQNYLYVLRDQDTLSGKSLTATSGVNGVVASESDSRVLLGSALVALPSSCSGTAASCAVTGIVNGWLLALPASGEKAMSAPLTVGGTVLLSTFVPPNSSGTVCTPSEGNGKLYGVSLDDGRPTIAQFNLDSDGDARSAFTAAPGLPGEIDALTTATLGVNAQTLDVQVTPYYRVYWRERRGDDEKPVAQ